MLNKEIRQKMTDIAGPKNGEKMGRVFSGCLRDSVFMGSNDTTMKLLQYGGFYIENPETQNCCGSLHGHSGEKNQAKELAKKDI